MRFFRAGGMLLMMAFLSATVSAAKVNEESEEGLRLSEMLEPEKNPQYRRVISAMSNPSLYEKAKILYLITQLKLSPYQFERNGAVYDGPKAASHLLAKYSPVKDRVETAEQFIDFVASGSSMSGQPYHILGSDGKRYLSHDVLMNELAELEERIEEIGNSTADKMPEEEKS